METKIFGRGFFGGRGGGKEGKEVMRFKFFFNLNIFFQIFLFFLSLFLSFLVYFPPHFSALCRVLLFFILV